MGTKIVPNYQERRRETISENALRKNSYSTKMHPGTENLQFIYRQLEVLG